MTAALPLPAFDAMGEQLAALRSARVSAEKRYLLRAKPEPKPAEPKPFPSYWHLKQEKQR